MPGCNESCTGVPSCLILENHEDTSFRLQTHRYVFYFFISIAICKAFQNMVECELLPTCSRTLNYCKASTRRLALNANETFHMQFVDRPAFILVTLEIMMIKIRAGPRTWNPPGPVYGLSDQLENPRLIG